MACSPRNSLACRSANEMSMAVYRVGALRTFLVAEQIATLALEGAGRVAAHLAVAWRRQALHTRSIGPTGEGDETEDALGCEGGGETCTIIVKGREVSGRIVSEVGRRRTASPLDEKLGGQGANRLGVGKVAFDVRRKGDAGPDGAGRGRRRLCKVGRDDGRDELTVKLREGWKAGDDGAVSEVSCARRSDWAGCALSVGDPRGGVRCHRRLYRIAGEDELIEIA